jgi:hypothetical protein
MNSSESYLGRLFLLKLSSCNNLSLLRNFSLLLPLAPPASGVATKDLRASQRFGTAKPHCEGRHAPLKQTVLCKSQLAQVVSKNGIKCFSFEYNTRKPTRKNFISPLLRFRSNVIREIPKNFAACVSFINGSVRLGVKGFSASYEVSFDA